MDTFIVRTKNHTAIKPKYRWQYKYSELYICYFGFTAIPLTCLE